MILGRVMWQEARTIARHPATVVVAGVAAALVAVSATLAASQPLVSLAGEWTLVAAVGGPFLQAGVALIAIYCGAFGLQTWRSRADDVWRTLPVDRTAVVQARVVARALIAIIASLLVVLPIGLIATVGAAPTDLPVDPIAVAIHLGLATIVPAAYFATGVTCMGLLLPSRWGIALPAGLTAAWLGLAWIGYDPAPSVTHDIPFRAMTGANPWWFARLATLGVLTPGPLIGACVGSIVHVGLAIVVDHRVRSVWDPRRDRDRIEVQWIGALARYAVGGTIVISTAVGSAAWFGLHGFDATAAQVTHPVTPSADRPPMTARLDVMGPIDGPLLGVWADRYTGGPAMPGSTPDRRWRTAGLGESPEIRRTPDRLPVPIAAATYGADRIRFAETRLSAPRSAGVAILIDMPAEWATVLRARGYAVRHAASEAPESLVGADLVVLGGGTEMAGDTATRWDRTITQYRTTGARLVWVIRSQTEATDSGWAPMLRDAGVTLEPILWEAGLDAPYAAHRLPPGSAEVPTVAGTALSDVEDRPARAIVAPVRAVADTGAGWRAAIQSTAPYTIVGDGPGAAITTAEPATIAWVRSGEAVVTILSALPASGTRPSQPTSDASQRWIGQILHVVDETQNRPPSAPPVVPRPAGRPFAGAWLALGWHAAYILTFLCGFWGWRRVRVRAADRY